MKKIIVFGSINMDLVVSVNDFPKPGETILGEKHEWFPGGKGANQALAIRRLGSDVGMVGKIGDDHLGQTATRFLEEEQVDITHIQTVSGSSTGLAVIEVNSNGENSIVVSPGANIIWPESEGKIRALLTGYDLVVLQLEIPISVVKTVLKVAKQLGIYTVLNTAPADRSILPALSNVDLLILNETETSLLSGKEDSENFSEAAQVLQGYGAKDIVITLGAQGCLVVTNGQSHVIPSYKVETVDTTAAGDVFVGAIITRLSQGDGILEAARWAGAAGALTVTRAGAQSSIPTKKKVDEFIKNF